MNDSTVYDTEEGAEEHAAMAMGYDGRIHEQLLTEIQQDHLARPAIRRVHRFLARASCSPVALPDPFCTLEAPLTRGVASQRPDSRGS